MQILAGSLQVVADWFLHAGYTSGSTFVATRLRLDEFVANPPVALDLAEALRLQNEVLGPGAAVADPATISRLDPWWVLGGCVALVAALACFYFRRRRQRQASLVPPLAAIACFLGIWFWTAAKPASTGPPSEVPEAAAYAHPREATEAILYGLIVDALHVQKGPLPDLEALRPDIGLPIANPTLGMRYALAHYPRDGWGRPFRVRWVKKGYTVTGAPDSGTACDGGHEVTSAGADGRFDTADDIRFAIGVPEMPYSWDPWALYARKFGNEYVMFVRLHREAPKWNKPEHPRLARRATGNNLFNLIRFSDLRRGDAVRVKLPHHYDALAAADGHGPMLLLVRESQEWHHGSWWQ